MYKIPKIDLSKIEFSETKLKRQKITSSKECPECHRTFFDKTKKGTQVYCGNKRCNYLDPKADTRRIGK